MARRRRKKDPTDLLLELVPPFVGLLVIGALFIPGFRQLLGALTTLIIWLLILAVAGFIGWVIWRKTRKAATPSASPPSPSSPSASAEPNWTLKLLGQLEWKRFEDVVASYSRELGYEAKTTRIGADGGVDVQLFQTGQAAPVMIIQCKAWDAYKVGVKPVRELYGVMAADKVANGAFFTTGEFTSEAEEWARDKNLDLVNGREFLERIRQLTPAAQQKLFEIATAGDYTTPTCPSCGVKMIVRTSSKGRSEGSTFYGCRHYPRCKQTFKIAAPT